MKHNRLVSMTIILLSPAALSCSSASDANQTAPANEVYLGDQQSDPDPWAPLRISGDEAEGFESLSEMRSSADLVVHGSITSFEVGRSIQYDAEDVVTYASATIDVRSVLSQKGELPEALNVEFLVTPQVGEEGRVIEGLNAFLAGQDVVLFLREKRAVGEEGLYRIVNSEGLWTEAVIGVHAPLRETVSDPAGAIDETSKFATELDGVDDLDGLAAVLRV